MRATSFWLSPTLKSFKSCSIAIQPWGNGSVWVVPEVLPVTRETIEQALELHRKYPKLQARDSLHAAVMRQHKITRIISADQHFDVLPDLERIAAWAR